VEKRGEWASLGLLRRLPPVQMSLFRLREDEPKSIIMMQKNSEVFNPVSVFQKIPDSGRSII